MLALVAVAAAFLGTGCQRSRRTLHEKAPFNALPRSLALSGLEAGPKSSPLAAKNPYEENAYAMTEGQRLYNWYNCSGCHFRGGGGIGPALMDDVWIYGKEPANLYASILEGRPNGMPSWRGKIPDYQIWQLVTYLQAGEGRHSR